MPVWADPQGSKSFAHNQIIAQPELHVLEVSWQSESQPVFMVVTGFIWGFRHSTERVPIPTTTLQERMVFLDRNEWTRTAGVHIPSPWSQHMILPVSSCPIRGFGNWINLFPLFPCGPPYIKFTGRIHNWLLFSSHSEQTNYPTAAMCLWGTDLCSFL